MKLLLADKRIDVNDETVDSCTSLHAASDHGRVEVVKLLLNVEGIDVDKAMNNGKTALKIATKRGHTEIQTLLRNDLHLS